MFPSSLHFAHILAPNLVLVDDKVTFLAGCDTPACQRLCVRKHPMLLCDCPLHVADWTSCCHVFTPVPDQTGSL
jgi:hypothetical protein